MLLKLLGFRAKGFELLATAGFYKVSIRSSAKGFRTDGV